MLLTVVTALLVVALIGTALTAALAFANGGAQTVFLPGTVVTATPQPDASATVIAGATPSAQATTQATAFATQSPNPTAQPTATSAPLPALTITPTPLVLTPLPSNTKTCSATQTITNNTSQTLGWTWQKPALNGFHFQVNNGPQLNWPTNTSPGIAPGGHDTLLASADCKAQPASFAVLMTDTLGNQYPFVLKVQ